MGAESIAMFQNAAYLVVSFLVVATLYTIFSPLLEGDKLKKRMDSVAKAREGMRVDRMEQLNKKEGLRSESKGLIKDMVDKLSLEKLLEASDLKDKLAQAGMRGQKPVYTFYIFRLILPIAGLLIGLILFVGLNISEWQMLQRITTSRRMAYENLARRNNHPGIRAVATALIQAERYGTPLGDTLRTMANENRQMRVMAAEKKAAALPAKLTVPMILFFLPVLFIVILTPASLRLMGALS